MVSRYAPEIYVSYDGDKAGVSATHRAIELARAEKLKVRVIALEGGKDPDEILKTHGPERFRALLQDAANDIEYRILQARSAYDFSTSDGKAGFLTEACKVLADLKSPVELDVYASRLAEETGVAKAAILAQVKSLQKAGAKRRERDLLRDARTAAAPAQKAIDTANPERARHLRAARAEETLLASLMHNPDIFSQIKEEVKPGDFVTAFNGRVYAAVDECMHAYGHFSLSMLEGRFTQAECSAVAAILALVPNLADTLQECRDCIRVIRQEKEKAGLASPSALSDADFLKLFRPD